jgi:hypothetical protein
MFTLPEIRVGASIHHESLTIFPLFAETNGGVEYQLSDEAIGAGTVTVEEVGESGSVPHLHVENKGDARVLFIEGEELRGAKQNRVLNTSVLIPAHSKTTIPVSCVEQGRWGYRSRRFGSGDSHSSPKLRAVLKKSVSASLEFGRGFTSDQGEVWKEVSRQMDHLGASSPTHAMADTYDSFRPRLGTRGRGGVERGCRRPLRQAVDLPESVGSAPHGLHHGSSRRRGRSQIGDGR